MSGLTGWLEGQTDWLDWLAGLTGQTDWQMQRGRHRPGVGSTACCAGLYRRSRRARKASKSGLFKYGFSRISRPMDDVGVLP